MNETVLPPHNIEAEQSVLGAIMLNNEVFHRVSAVLLPIHFHEPVHALIYEAITKLVRVGKTADPITLRTQLPAEFVEGMTMPQYLAALLKAPATIINAVDYASVVRDLAVKRDLLKISDEMAYEARRFDSALSATQQIEEAERSLHELAKSGSSYRGFAKFSESLTAAVENTAAAYQRDGGLAGISTGLIGLDRQMGGMQRSDLIILAARPGMGKSALATNIGFHAAVHFKLGADGKAADGARVGFFSLEMSAEQLATRILAEQCNIPSSALRRGDIRENQFTDLVDASNRIGAAPFFIDDTGGMSVHQLAAKARRQKRRFGMDLMIVDYLQLLSGSRGGDANRVQELTEVTTTLKALAKELDIPVLALSQLSRAVENRQDKHPQLSDLRESGSIEQDADVVLFVYREAYYHAMIEPAEVDGAEHVTWAEKMDTIRPLAEVIIGKQRHGPTGTVRLHFNDALTRFTDPAKPYLTEESFR